MTQYDVAFNRFLMGFDNKWLDLFEAYHSDNADQYDDDTHEYENSANNNVFIHCSLR